VTALLLAAVVLAVLAIRALQIPQVRMGLAVVAGLAAGLAAAEGYGAVVLALAVVMAAGTLGAVALLHQHVVPARAVAGGGS
jgi:hypothetical protein